MDSTEAARHLASLRKHRDAVCPICGSPFVAYGRQRYDRKACANMASYRRVGRSRASPPEAPAGVAMPAPRPPGPTPERARELAAKYRREGDLEEAEHWERIAAKVADSGD